ncbi:hypothetical protein [Foetidibacter luteolus]|uniref:hypothetical protein n=1 Tax=Foetidibacter luteolus TaxID=2608880 RepID=UPI00129A4374|nr:hypothetical protein [Foetidibacter luteolus]
MKKIPKLLILLIPGIILTFGVCLFVIIAEPDEIDTEAFLYIWSIASFLAGLVYLLAALLSVLLIILSAWRKAFLYAGLIMIGLCVILFKLASVLWDN